MEQNKIYKIDAKTLYTYPYKKPAKVFQKIELNEKETELFNLIKSILAKNNRNTICRVAGGWVRDKLLGKNSDDIDIALDDMKGEELAKMINDELYPGETKYGVMKKDNEKSKHLETATMNIFGTSVDFVNLRSETYTEDSRIPIVDIGTPEEDAKRRDITINSMFYNINSDEIEDFLKSGIDDLSNGYIRTPLNPETTFKDDPLRILRVVRFAVRFEFQIDPLIEQAAQLEDIKSALNKKISNERIAKELCLMLGSNKPQCAVYLIYKFNILDSIYDIYNAYNEESTGVAELDLVNSVNYTLLGAQLLSKNNLNLFLSEYYDLESNKKLFFLILMTLPYHNYNIQIKKEILKGNAYIIRDSLKLPNEYVGEVNIISENISKLSEYVNLRNFDRLTSAKIIRKVKYSFLNKLTAIAICYDYIETVRPTILLETIDDNLFESIIAKYKDWYNYLETEKLFHIDELEPIFKGDKLAQMFKARGKEIGFLLESLIEEQIKDPSLIEEDAIAFINKKREEFTGSAVLDNKKKQSKK